MRRAPWQVRLRSGGGLLDRCGWPGKRMNEVPVLAFQGARAVGNTLLRDLPAEHDKRGGRVDDGPHMLPIDRLWSGWHPTSRSQGRPR